MCNKMAETKEAEKWKEIIRPQNGKKCFQLVVKLSAPKGSAKESDTVPEGAEVQRLPENEKSRCEKDKKYSTPFGVHKFLAYTDDGAAEFEVLKENWSSRSPAKFYVHTSDIREEDDLKPWRGLVGKNQFDFEPDYNGSGCICF